METFYTVRMQMHRLVSKILKFDELRDPTTSAKEQLQADNVCKNGRKHFSLYCFESRPCMPAGDPIF